MELEKLSGVELGKEVRSGHITPTEVIRYFQERIEIPPSARSFPQGIYVSFFLETDDLFAVRPDQLAAVRSYLKEHGLRPVSDTTAYLYRTTFSDTGYCFQFCVRVRVEREEP